MDTSKFILAYIDTKNSEDMLSNFFKNGAERGVIFEGLNINSELIECFNLMRSKGYFPLGAIIDPNSTDTEFIFHRHPNQIENDKLIETKETKSTKL
jgi:hypothetical protein